MRILLNKLRNERGITLIRLAELSGVSKSTLNNIENGKTSPTIDQMEKIANALGVKIEELYDSEK